MSALGGPSELTRLADKAAEHSSGHAVAVLRGFDRGSRHRAAALRRKLQRRGVVTIDLTPLVLTLRHRDRTAVRTVLDDGTIGLVVDAGPGSTQAPHLAAELGVPLLRSRRLPDPARHSVLGVFLGDVLTAVGLERVELRPLDEQECQLTMQSGTGPAVQQAGTVSVRLEHPEVGRAARMVVDPVELALAVDGRLAIAAHWGPYTLVVDDRAVAPLSEPVTIRCLVDRLEHLSA